MQRRRGWFSWRIALLLRRHRFLLTFPPAWNRWGLALTIFLLLPLGYFLSAMPTVMVLRKSGLMTPPVEGCVLLFYAPLVWLDQHSPTFHGFFKAEGRLIEIIFGE